MDKKERDRYNYDSLTTTVKMRSLMRSLMYVATQFPIMRTPTKYRNAKPNAGVQAEQIDEWQRNNLEQAKEIYEEELAKIGNDPKWNTKSREMQERTARIMSRFRVEEKLKLLQ